jgi:hypothetical protein
MSARPPWIRGAILAPLAAGILPACAPPPPPAPAEPAVDLTLVHHAADAALAALARRKYSVAGCDASAAQLVAEAEVRGAPPGDACSVRVAKQKDNTWLVVIRSASQPGKPQALVTVSPGGEGAQHIDYVY